MQRGFVSALVVIVLSAALLGGGAYYFVKKSSQSSVSEVQTSVTAGIQPTQTTTQTQPSVPVQANTTPTASAMPAKTTSTPAAAPTQPSVGQFVVKKISKDYVFDFYQTERTLDLSVTTQPLAADPKTLSLCSTLTDVNNVALTETDCWPLEKYGTWSYMANGDLSLAPLDGNDAFWTEGLHPIKIRFELVQGITNDYTEQKVRARYPLLATDDTGVFNLRLRQEPN